MARWEKERESEKVKGVVEKTTEQAQNYGFTGTPSFAIKGPKTNGVKLLGSTLTTSEEFEEAINEAG